MGEKNMKQESLEGLGQIAIADLTEAGKELRAARKERMKFSKKEKMAIEKVLAVMHDYKIPRYKDDSEDPPLELEILPGKEKVKVNGVVDDEDEE